MQFRSIALSAMTALVLLALAPEANAASVTFNFDAKYDAAASAANATGDTSNLIDFSAGLVDGQIIHGSLSYDPAAAPLVTNTGTGFNTANYGSLVLSLTLPTFNGSLPNFALVIDATTSAVTTDRFQTGFPIDTSFTGHSIMGAVGLDFIGSLTTFSSTSLPSSLHLADFTSAIFYEEQTDIASGQTFGHNKFVFNLISLTDGSETPPGATPLPAALPLFVGGLGALGLLGWCRKRKAAALAA
jgi:hypothetical protein